MTPRSIRCFLVLASLSRPAAAAPLEDQVIVIRLDSTREASAIAVPEADYRRIVSTALTSVNQSMIPVLEKRRSAEPSSAPMVLNSLGVGLNLAAQIGLGPLLSITVSPQLRLVYTDSDNPVFPD